MRTENLLALLGLIAIVGAMFLTATPAITHSFNVALVIQLSTPDSNRGREIYEGFMLATAERDSHPDQKSDGHLGGLDVYVTVIDEQEGAGVKIRHLAERGEVTIVAAFTSKSALSSIQKTLAGKEVALLLPGHAPVLNSDLPAVTAFKSAYKRRFGRSPSIHAAQGYNAARRIDKAVRAQGGIDDLAAIVQALTQSSIDFTW